MVDGKLFISSKRHTQKFENAVKRAKTKKSLNKAYSVHKKDHDRLLKRHLREEMALINKLKKKLD